MEQMANLAAAMAKAFPNIANAVKDKQNPHFRSAYADLGNVVDAIKPALKDQGLWFVQTLHNIPDHAAVETIIVHSSGEFLSCGIIAIPVSKKDAQGFGSALTYARRYSLSAAFGVAPEDDDGNAAVKAKPEAKPETRIDNNLMLTYQSAFKSVKTLDELTILWNNLDKDAKIACEEFKNEAKARIK
jgi:hypothetical protein